MAAIYIDTVLFSYNPTEIEITPAPAAESQAVTGNWLATPRAHGVKLKITWGVDVSVTAVVAALRTARGGSIAHQISFTDLSAVTWDISVNWTGDPPFVNTLENLYKSFSITFNECQELP